MNDDRKIDVPDTVIRRLPRYYRFLRELLIERKLRISSGELSKLMGVTASQIRQDLGYFGGFGQKGYGYNIKYLYTRISDILGVSAGYRAIILGAGNLGRALASGAVFTQRGVEPVGIFDASPEVIGTTVAGMTVLDIAELEPFLASCPVQIAVLTTTREAAPALAKRLASLGIRGIWNFTDRELSMEKGGTTVYNICLGDSLMTLCYEIGLTEEEHHGTKTETELR